MNLFRLLLVLIFLSITGYTAVVVAEHGMNLIPIFFGDMAAMGWPGQFNFDFFWFLVLSATWVAWRHQFTLPGLVLALFAFFGGALFLSGYLLIESFRVSGSHELLLGQQRAQQQ